MCFGSKERKLVDDDDAPHPAPGHFPQQPTYAAANPPKSNMPPQYVQQQQPPQPQSTSQYYGSGPVELPSVKQSKPPAELSSTAEFAPPPGPPPSHAQSQTQTHVQDFSPPPGPPPSQMPQDDFAPPPGPPPSSESKPKHDWESAVPDTALFPPPPAIFSGFYRSPTSNASEEESRAGEAWCEQYPLFAPLTLDAPSLAALRANDPRLITPTPNYRGTLAWTAPGVWAGHTTPDSGDSCIIAYPPLYLVREHSPLATGWAKTVYYEVRIKALGGGKSGEEGSIALGFTAMPYPAFRMPGWHRGSLAVHGDDGHRYINDTWGGKSFTTPFRAGETVGIGMTFRVVDGGRVNVEVFMTRAGRRSGEWDLHEEGDSVEDRSVVGLEGFHDLSCAVGTYKGTEFEVVFDPARWIYQVPKA